MSNIPYKSPLAGYSSDTFAADNLVVGDRPLRSRKMTLASGVVLRGMVMGTVVGAATAAAAAGNTGNGAFGAVTVGAGVKPGVYQITCIEPAANAGVFLVEGPDGVTVGRATVAVAFTGPINFTIADGATDFISGDRFTVTVAEPDTDVKQAVAAATDGSAIPKSIAVHDADATAAPVELLVYTAGEFSESALTIGAGLTIAAIREPLRTRGIHLVSTLPNA